MKKSSKEIWKELNERYGISNMEQLEKEMKKVEIDISIFTMPLRE